MIDRSDLTFDSNTLAMEKSRAELLSAELHEIFRSDERSWLSMVSRLDKYSVEEQSLYMLDASTAMTLVRSTIANRTQRRLLLLHAMIAKYRWENGKLPASLSEISEEIVTDPANGQAFVYSKFSPAAYDLYSPGNSYYGPIRLQVYGIVMPRGTDGPP